MKKVNSVEEYIESNAHFGKALTVLRALLNSTELEETLKWNSPVYAINNKNVLGLGAFKNHFCLWFFNGIFLKDDKKLLINAQEEKTKALRQMRFKTIEDIDKNTVLAYVKEAIENQKLGKEIKPEKTTKKPDVPLELKILLNTKTDLKTSFEALSLSKQREYCQYISEAKRETTKQLRLEKIAPMVLKGVGLHDKYKK